MKSVKKNGKNDSIGLKIQIDPNPRKTSRTIKRNDRGGGKRPEMFFESGQMIRADRIFADLSQRASCPILFPDKLKYTVRQIRAIHLAAAEIHFAGRSRDKDQIPSHSTICRSSNFSAVVLLAVIACDQIPSDLR